MTGREMITGALRLIGAIAPGEALQSSEASDGLATLNAMLGSWSNEGLLIHGVTEESPLTLTPGDATVTLGTSGDITTRPMEIKKALIRDGSTDYPVRMLTASEYADIKNKTLRAIPHSAYDDGGYPLRTLKLFPVPSAANSLVLFTKRQLTEIASLSTSISLPPGYDEAIKYNLAIRLAPEYGRTVAGEVALIAVESKASIKRSNHKPGFLKVDSAVRARGGFNIITGENE